MGIRKQPESPIVHFAYGAILGAIAGALFTSAAYVTLDRFGLGRRLGPSFIVPENYFWHCVVGGIIFGGLGGSFSGGIASPKMGLLLGLIAILVFGFFRLSKEFDPQGDGKPVLGFIFLISGIAGIIAGLAEHKLKIVRQRKPDPWDEFRNPGQRQHDSKEN